MRLHLGERKIDCFNQGRVSDTLSYGSGGYNSGQGLIGCQKGNYHFFGQLCGDGLDHMLQGGSTVQSLLEQSTGNSPQFLKSTNVCEQQHGGQGAGTLLSTLYGSAASHI